MSRWLWIFLFPVMVWGGETVVESNLASYNGKKLTLTGEVCVAHAMGRMTAQQAILTRDEEGRTRLDFPWVELTQAVTFTLPNGNRLDCDYVFVDYTQMTSHFTGVPQVAYSDERGEVWADEAYVDYREVDGKIEPVEVRLLRDVRLIYLESEQYALADRVTYYPSTQRLVLEGIGRRVLFFDKKRNLQISAPIVYAARHPETRKDSIEGKGDVRFIFAEEEFARLKEHFTW